MIETSRLKNIKTVLVLCAAILFLLDRVNHFIMFLEVRDCNSFHTAAALIDNEVGIIYFFQGCFKFDVIDY